ncbi:MAG: TetR/AcrR family transcriptional regulator [Candidatus Thorarchaeota archaeon]
MTESPRQKRTNRERALRRSDIIAAANSLFLENGYNNTTMDEIAEKAGFSKVTVYNYFSTKDDLYLAVAALAFKTWADTFDETIKKWEVKGLSKGFARFIKEHPGYAIIIDDKVLRPSLVQIMKKEEDNEELSESESEFRMQQLRIFGVLMKAIQGTIGENDLRGKISHLEIANALSNLVSGMTSELIIREEIGSLSPSDTEKQLDLIMNIIDGGIKTLTK